MTILINTPTGNIGRALAEQLLDAGEALVVIHRNPDKVADLAARGARVVKGSTDDAAVLDEAFAGVDAVFWITPPAYRPDYLDWARHTAEKAVAAAQAHNVKRAVLLSSVGAHSERVGPVSALAETEAVFRNGFADLMILRPAYFMENLLRDLDSIRTQGAFYAPVPNDVPMPWVATADIAAVAAEELRAARNGQHIRGVHGPTDLSFDQAAAILSSALGRAVTFTQVPEAAAREAMLGAGLPAFVTDMFLEMYEGMSAGRMAPAELRSAETTTSTDLAAFAQQHLRPALAAA